MQPARSTVETPPDRDDLRRNQPRPPTGSSPNLKRPDPGRTPSASVSPPVARRNAGSSAYSTHTPAAIDTVASPGSPTGTANESLFGTAGSPPQAGFPARDGSEAGNVRRTSRRRTGPLSASQREKAALIRKIGACNDCRRRRVACHPSHHDMSWEEAVQKYRSLTPTPDIGGAMNLPPRAPHGSQMSLMDRDSQEMDIDAAPSPAASRRDSIHERTPQPPMQLHEHPREHQREHPHDLQQHQQHHHLHPHHRSHQHLHMQQQHHRQQQLHPQQEQPTLPPPQPSIERKPLLQAPPHAHAHPYASSHSSQPRFHGPPQQPLPSPSSPRIKPQLLSPILPPPPGVRLPAAGGSGGSGSSSVGGGSGGETRLRTPLPSGRSLEKLAAAALPSMQQRFPDDLQSAAARIINQANPHRSRYDAVHALLLVWSNEDDPEVLPAVEELQAVLETQYHYTVELRRIPAGAHSPYRWLLQTVMQFVNNRDLRDSLKVLYYAGGSYVDREREMVLSSVADNDHTPTIRWSGIQQVLEDASADTLVLMDAAYYPCGRMARREGVLELLAASVGWDATRMLGRALFTRVLADELRLRCEQQQQQQQHQQQQQQQQLFRGTQASIAALSAAELHVRLMAKYHQRLQEVRLSEQPAQQSPQQPNAPLPAAAGFPAPLHMQMAANARLPSILLSPCRRPASSSPEASGPSSSMAPSPGSQVTLTLRLNENVLDKPGWTEWMRLLPEGVCDVRCDGGPFASSAFR